MLTLAGLNEPSSRELITLVAMTGGFVIAIIAIISTLIRGIVRTRTREQTKRELAAYIAEGSMKPEDAERIIAADIPKWEKAC